jgi:hypothetical protein
MKLQELSMEAAELLRVPVTRSLAEHFRVPADAAYWDEATFEPAARERRRLQAGVVIVFAMVVNSADAAGLARRSNLDFDEGGLKQSILDYAAEVAAAGGRDLAAELSVLGVDLASLSFADVTFAELEVDFDEPPLSPEATPALEFRQSILIYGAVFLVLLSLCWAGTRASHYIAMRGARQRKADKEQKRAEERANEVYAKVKAGDPSRKRYDVGSRPDPFDRHAVEWRELGGEEHSDGKSVGQLSDFEWDESSKYGRGRDLPKNYQPIKPALSFRYGRGRELPKQNTFENSPQTNTTSRESPLRSPNSSAVESLAPSPLSMPVIPEDVVRPAPEVPPRWTPIAMCDMHAASCLTEADAAHEQAVAPPPLMRLTIARGPCEVAIHTSSSQDDEVVVEPNQDSRLFPIDEVSTRA